MTYHACLGSSPEARGCNLAQDGRIRVRALTLTGKPRGRSRSGVAGAPANDCFSARSFLSLFCFRGRMVATKHCHFLDTHFWHRLLCASCIVSGPPYSLRASSPLPELRCHGEPHGHGIRGHGAGIQRRTVGLLHSLGHSYCKACLQPLYIPCSAVCRAMTGTGC